ncbi:hypothetical protein, partial [Pseudokineococcus sp. 1T1Z-3]|uniref:hypothetical protein n=1 Tax=Pseudokineococcus sp. 1T1Z-3 TaxID=3132745 RepID=UPI0030A45F47
PLEPTPEDRRQALLDEPQPGDDDVVGLTRAQAIKLAAILDAAMRADGASGAGENLWADAVLDSRDLLLAHAYNDRRPAPGIPTVTDADARLAAWPWPPQKYT